MDEFTPADFAGLLLDGTVAILPYVAAGVVGGLVLLFVFLGIRKGLSFFRGTVTGYDDDGNWKGLDRQQQDAYERFKETGVIG